MTLAPDGPSVIRADRFRRVLVDKDGVPQIGLIGGCPYDLDDAHAERLMADVRAHGCFVTVLRSYGKQMEADRILHMLDLCRKYGLKAQVSWGLCLNDYWCPFCVGDEPSKTHSGGENGRPLDPKKVAVNMEVLRKIRDHPAFFWSHTVDEPTERQLEKSTAVITEQEHVDPHHPHFALLNNAMMMRMFSPLMREVVHLDNYGRADGDVWASARSVAKWADCRPMTYDIHSMAGAMMMPAVSPEQLRNMAYQAIVVGAGIIEPFVYRPWSGKLYAEWTNLGSEMKALTPAIAAEEWLDAPDPGEFGGITWSWRFTPEAAYLITLSVAKGDKPRTIDLPKGWSYATKAEVMFENRTLDAKDGKLADTWSQYGRHVYRFAK